jgi:hypothetical protein
MKTATIVPNLSKPTRHYLRNVYGWTLVYETWSDGANWNAVRVVKNWKGEQVDEMFLTRDEARQHYACQLRAGFLAPDTNW